MAESDIFVRFGADIDPLKRGTKDASNSLQAFGNKTKQVSMNLAKMAAVAAVAAAAIGVKLVNDSLSAIDAQAKMARQLGTSSASLATLGRAADMSGISMGSIEKGAKNLEVAMGEAAGGTGEALKTLERLNLTAKDLEGMTLDEKILTVNKALKDNIPVNERAAAASDLFGKKAGFAIAQLSPETIEEARRQTEGMGLALSDVDAAKVEAANDAMATIGLAVDGVVSQFTVALAPMLEAVAVLFQEAAIESGGFKEEAQSAANGVATAVGFVADQFNRVGIAIDAIKVAFKAVQASSLAFAGNVGGYLDQLIMGFKTSINEVITMANAIVPIDMALLVVGGSDVVAGIKDAAIAANQELGIAIENLKTNYAAPVPSEVIDEFILSLGHERIIEAEILKNDQLSEIERSAKDQSIRTEAEKLSALDKLRASWETTGRKGTQQFFGDLSTLTQVGNKNLFNIGKAAAAANIAIGTQQSASDAYKWGSAFGPGFAAAAAGAALVAGAVRLSALKSVSYGGGGGGGGSAGGAVAQAPQVQQQAPEQRRTVSVQSLDPNSLVSGSMVNSIAEQLVELQNDGFKLVV
jgi:hypothetical protein